MAIIDDVKEVLHRSRVLLHPNYLPGVEGYHARTVNEAMLTVEDVGAALRNRGGFSGSYDDMIVNVRLWLKEAIYQVMDGFGVDFGFFTMHPSIGGVFQNEKEAHDHKKHPITVHYRSKAKFLKLLREYVTIIIEGLVDANGRIYDLFDVLSETQNDILTIGNMFIIHGDKIKIMGDDPTVGIYFQSVNDPTVEYKVDYLAKNLPGEIIGMVPALLKDQQWRVVVRTQFTGSNIPLKAPRSIVSKFIVELV